MSHVITAKAKIGNLDAAEVACQRLGLELVRDQEEFKWFGRYVGDHPLPEFFTAEDLGKCSHAIRIPNDEDAYEIGLVELRESDGGDGYRVVDGVYTLMYDFWGGGHGMAEMVGGDLCSDLTYEYFKALAETTHTTHMQEVEMQEDGSMILTLRSF